MTYQEIEEIAKLERTCDELRTDNAQLLSYIYDLRHTLSEAYKMNSLGKTKQLADIIYATLNK